MRILSENAERESKALASGDPWLVLIDITADNQTLRVVNNNEPITHAGNEYTPYAFAFSLPKDSLESDPSPQLIIGNVDRSISDALRSTDYPRFTARVVLASQPDVVEVMLTDMVIRSVVITATTLTATLAFDNTWTDAFPGIGAIYDPSQCPGLF